MRKTRYVRCFSFYTASLLVVPLLTACTYLNSALQQAGYALAHKTDPSQRNLKHMIQRQSYFVYGKILDDGRNRSNNHFTVAAFSGKYKSNELVDFAFVENIETHYGLSLPEGDFDLLVLVDHDENGNLQESEVVGSAQLNLDPQTYPDHIAEHVDILPGERRSVDWKVDLPAPVFSARQESLFYPRGTIRELNDPLFDSNIASLGMYAPASFLERAKTMFYALEEDSYKIPVVFVHGIGGSAREFAKIVEKLDRQRYQPWFFYYPSGMRLEQLSQLFFDLFLSGTVITRGEMPVVIVAHSMGGLVVREALNKVRGEKIENRAGLLITLATPFGGHPDAARGLDHAPMVVPSWRDLDPKSRFIARLFRKPLDVRHQLIYAHGDSGQRNGGKKSDGVVPVDSQLRSEALAQSSGHFGFATSHAGILQEGDVIDRIIDAIDGVKSIYPESHLKILASGGYDVELDDSFSEQEKHIIRNSGKFFSAIGNGTLSTLSNPELERIARITRGKVPAESKGEKAWLRFLDDYPQFGPDASLKGRK